VRYRGVEIRGAYLDPLACVIFMRLLERPEVAPLLADLLRGLALSADAANRLAVEQVESTIAQMTSARRDLMRERDEHRGSAGGTSEPQEPAAQTVSAVSPPRTSRVAEVAERLELSESYVKRLCRDRVLSATKVGREWVIDAASVDEYEAARRPVA
jgi:excisionase family DNA binding protein